MKKLLTFILCSVLFSLAIFSTALAGSQDFTLVNESGFDIYEIYISPSSSDDWEEDILEEDILLNGDYLEINFDYGDVEIWDLLIVDEEGNEFYWEEFNFNELSTIRIYNENDEIWASWD